jgi:acyl-coenzyme A synthetase/AMP-(fatty) acid ligase
MIFDRLLELPPDAEPWIVDHQPIAVSAHEEKIPPSAIADAAARAATVLGDNGVVPGRRCVVWLESPVDVIIAYSAITAMGAVPILISPSVPADVLTRMVAGVPDITAAVATGERLDQLRDDLPDLAPVDWREVAARLPASSRFAPPRAVPSDAPYVVVHTSGTTGIPKLVECSSRSIDFNAKVQAVIHWATRLHGHLAMVISPVHGRTVVGILCALMRQAPLMLLNDDSPENVERMLTRHRPIYLETHPNTFRAWQHLAPRGAFRSVRMFGAGFDVIHPDTVRALLSGSGYRSALCVEVYGQNESGPIAIRCHLRPLMALARRRSGKVRTGHGVGPRFPFCRVRILGESGEPLPAGAAGRVVVRTPGTFTRYLNRPGQTSRNHPRGRWWDTGDWGSKSRLGFVTLLDRAADRVSLGPSAIALENALLEKFPEFLELVVLDGRDRLRPVLSLRPGSEFRPQAWRESTVRLAPMTEPVIIPDHDFPRTVTGKVKRSELTARLAMEGQPR